jgi:hypothetical protein
VIPGQFTNQLSPAWLGIVGSCAGPGAIKKEWLCDALALSSFLQAGKPEVVVLPEFLLGVIPACECPDSAAI